MKRVEVPVILRKDELDVLSIATAFRVALIEAFMQLGNDNHPQEQDADVVLQYRVVDGAN
jgi:hypothetical protein